VKLLNRILSENVKRAQLYLLGISMLSNFTKFSKTLAAPHYPLGSTRSFIGALTRRVFSGFRRMAYRTHRHLARLSGPGLLAKVWRSRRGVPRFDPTIQ